MGKTSDERGLEAFRTQQRPSRSPKLTKEQLKEIETVFQANPKEFGFKLWDGESLSVYIGNELQIELGVRQCRQLSHTLGFSLIRPQQFPRKGFDDIEKRELLKNEQI